MNATTKKPAALTHAERQALYRARKGRQVVLYLDDELAEALDAYVRRQQMDGEALTRSEVISKLLRTQLLRKR